MRIRTRPNRHTRSILCTASAVLVAAALLAPASVQAQYEALIHSARDHNSPHT